MITFDFNGIFVPVSPYEAELDVIEYFRRCLTFERKEGKR